MTKFLTTTLFCLVFICSCQNKETGSGQSKKAEQTIEQQKTSQADVSSTSDQEAATSKSEDNSKPNAIAHYICYTNDTNKDRRIWIAFTEESKAVKVKYEGQTESIDLAFQKQDFQKGDAYPTTIDYYDEIYDGKKNGMYKLTHSGNWDYVAYTRGKDGKVFNFTIDHDANPYGKQPCF